MKTKVIQPFKGTINQTTIEHEWIFNTLTSIISRIETTFPYSYQSIILTNDHKRLDIDAYVLPKDFDKHCLRLSEKLNFFKQYGDNFLKDIYNEIKELQPIECDYLTHGICNQLKNNRI